MMFILKADTVFLSKLDILVSFNKKFDESPKHQQILDMCPTYIASMMNFCCFFDAAL